MFFVRGRERETDRQTDRHRVKEREKESERGLIIMTRNRFPKPTEYFDLLCLASIVFMAVTGLLMKHAALSEIL